MISGTGGGGVTRSGAQNRGVMLVIAIATITLFLTWPHRSVPKAPDFYQTAADQGYAGAKYDDRLSQSGQGVPNAATQHNLGLRYRDGQGMPKDLAKAAELYQKAADQGYTIAQSNLALLYPEWIGRAEGFRESNRALSKSG